MLLRSSLFLASSESVGFDSKVSCSISDTLEQHKQAWGFGIEDAMGLTIAQFYLLRFALLS